MCCMSLCTVRVGREVYEGDEREGGRGERVKKLKFSLLYIQCVARVGDVEEGEEDKEEEDGEMNVKSFMCSTVWPSWKTLKTTIEGKKNERTHK